MVAAGAVRTAAVALTAAVVVRTATAAVAVHTAAVAAAAVAAAEVRTAAAAAATTAARQPATQVQTAMPPSEALKALERTSIMLRTERRGASAKITNLLYFIFISLFTVYCTSTVLYKSTYYCTVLYAHCMAFGLEIGPGPHPLVYPRPRGRGLSRRCQKKYHSVIHNAACTLSFEVRAVDHAHDTIAPL